jgi:hypothetical protein
LRPASQGRHFPQRLPAERLAQLRQAAPFPVRQSEPVLAKPLQQRRVLSTLVLDHPRLLLSHPHPDPCRQELQGQGQQLLRHRCFRRAPHSAVLRAVVTSVKSVLANRQVSGIPSASHYPVSGHDGERSSQIDRDLVDDARAPALSATAPRARARPRMSGGPARVISAGSSPSPATGSQPLAAIAQAHHRGGDARRRRWHSGHQAGATA